MTGSTKTAGASQEKPLTLTQERVLFDHHENVLGLDVGITVSSLKTNGPHGGKEVIQQVGPGQGAAWEMVWGSMPLWGVNYLEVQGPAVSTGHRSSFPVRARLAGLGVTACTKDHVTDSQLSYTAEVQITPATVAELARLATPTAVLSAAKAIHASPVANRVSNILAIAIGRAAPLVSAVIALFSIKHALRVLRDADTTLASKTGAVARAIMDSIAVVLPIVGAIGSAAVGAASLTRHWLLAKTKNFSAGPEPESPPVRDQPSVPSHSWQLQDVYW